MQRRTFLVMSAGALATTGCLSDEERLQVTTSSNAPPPTRIERVLLWLPPQTGLASAKFGEAFVSAFAPYGVTVRVDRAKALELNRGEEQAASMSEMEATHRLEVEVATLSQGGSMPSSQSTFIVSFFIGTSTRPVATFRYVTSSYYDYALAGLVVKKLRGLGYL
ncbi:hypothetical protein BH11PSE3_BH11PSE3_33480 [soil metagenome]